MRPLLIANVMTIATMFSWWLFRNYDKKVDIFLFSEDSEYPKYIAHDLGFLITNTVLYFTVYSIISKKYKSVVMLFVGLSVFRIIEYILFHGDTDFLPIVASFVLAILVSLYSKSNQPK